MAFSTCLAPGASGGGTFAIASTAVATVALLAFLRWSLYPKHPSIIPNPLKTVLPKLSAAEIARLDYTPDAFPGARDVATPYGSIRVYEFGPATGRKVLFLHGISTACHTLHPLATALAARGCRVLLFDLFGRGFSDGVGDLPHDARLYTAQALLAMASSPLSWTGTDACDVVGYSMGGGVAVHLAAALPATVRSLILLAPAGLIRPESFGRLTRFVFAGGLVPERLLAALTRRRLREPIARSSKVARARAAATPPADAAPRRAPTDPVELAAAEVDDPRDGAPRTPLTLRVTAYVRWMLNHHDGFVPAFMSCVRVAPMVGQEAAWSALAATRRARAGDKPAGAKKSVCVVLAEADEIIDPVAYEADALPLLGGRGPDGVAEWHIVPGGHDFPMTHAAETLRVIYDFWGMRGDDEEQQ